MNQPSIPPSQGVKDLLEILENIQNKSKAESILKEMEKINSEVSAKMQENANFASKINSEVASLEKLKLDVKEISDALAKEQEEYKLKSKKLEERQLIFNKEFSNLEEEKSKFSSFLESKNFELKKLDSEALKNLEDSKKAKDEYESLLSDYNLKLAKLKELAGG